MEQLIQQTVERGKVPNKRIIKQGQENNTSNGLMSYFRRSSTNNTPGLYLFVFSCDKYRWYKSPKVLKIIL